ncbi:hypothetical protein [Salinicola avicenniae]|uniref:hypothetical protein n=1 Tax=Salinicola avicenniae TaxID=2916836 RepID=UPI00207490DC|nr:MULTISPECIES: hypothetical protein [unclassified Salinicola]
MKNRIEDLRNHLFAELERLGDEELSGEALEAELKRAKAIGAVAQNITDSARVEVEYLKATGQDRGTGFLPPAEGREPLPPGRG